MELWLNMGRQRESRLEVLVKNGVENGGPGEEDSDISNDAEMGPNMHVSESI